MDLEQPESYAIFITEPKVEWDDIKGLEKAKRHFTYRDRFASKTPPSLYFEAKTVASSTLRAIS